MRPSASAKMRSRATFAASCAGASGPSSGRPPRRARGGRRRSPPPGLRPPPRRLRSPAGSVLAQAAASFSSGKVRVLHSRSFPSFRERSSRWAPTRLFFRPRSGFEVHTMTMNEQLQNEIEQMLHDRSPDVEVVLAERAATGPRARVHRPPAGRRHALCERVSRDAQRRCASATRSRCPRRASSGRWCAPTTTGASVGSRVDVRTIEPIDGRRHFTATCSSPPTTRASISSRTTGGCGSTTPPSAAAGWCSSPGEGAREQGNSGGRQARREGEGDRAGHAPGRDRGRAARRLPQDARRPPPGARRSRPRHRRLHRVDGDRRRLDEVPGRASAPSRAGRGAGRRHRPGRADRRDAAEEPEPEIEWDWFHDTRARRRDAGQLQPHRRPDRQAGAAPADPRGRALDDVRRVRRPRRRDRDRHRAAGRPPLRVRRPRPHGGDPARLGEGAGRALRAGQPHQGRDHRGARPRARARRSCCRAAPTS